MTTKLVAVRSGMMAFGSRVIPVVISGMRALGVAAMANPIGLVIGGLALTAGLIIANWEKVKSFFTTIWEPIRPYWETFAGWVGKIWDKISSPLKTIKSMWSSVSGFLGGGEGDQKIQIGKTIRTTAVAAGMAVTPMAAALSASGSIASAKSNPTTLTQTSAPVTAGPTTINATINVYGASGQDENIIVQKVMMELAQLKTQAARGALHD
jgi:hypothetical protein